MMLHNPPFRVSLLTCCMAIVLSTVVADQASLDPNLEPLRPFLGKTWRGEFKNSTPEKPLIDIVRWERALNGKAVRILHSLNRGVYGGESLVIWDPKRQAVTYHYFTTAGFTTTGTITFGERKVMTHEVVDGGAEGVTEVRGTTELRQDGTFRITTEYLKKGEWTPGRDAIYKEAPEAKVEFQ